MPLVQQKRRHQECKPLCRNLYAAKRLLDFGKRQELASTVNNEFQYHLDQKKEQSLKDEREKYRNTLIMVLLAAIILAGLGYILHVRRRNKHLREIVALSSTLQKISDNDKQLRADIEKKEQELMQSRKSLEKSSDELTNVKRELLRVNVELSDYSAVLKEKEQQLAEKMIRTRRSSSCCTSQTWKESQKMLLMPSRTLQQGRRI